MRSELLNQVVMGCLTDGVQMRLDDYITMTTAPSAADQIDTRAKPAQLLGTVHTEASFLAKFGVQPAAYNIDTPLNESAFSSAPSC